LPLSSPEEPKEVLFRKVSRHQFPERDEGANASRGEFRDLASSPFEEMCYFFSERPYPASQRRAITNREGGKGEA